MSAIVDRWRRQQLKMAEATGRIVALTGPDSIATPPTSTLMDSVEWSVGRALEHIERGQESKAEVDLHVLADLFREMAHT